MATTFSFTHRRSFIERRTFWQTTTHQDVHGFIQNQGSTLNKLATAFLICLELKNVLA